MPLSRSRPFGPLSLLALLSLLIPALGQQAPPAMPEPKPRVTEQAFYKLALEAMQDEIPAAAAVKLARAYPDSAAKFGEGGRQLIGERLIECLVRAGRYAEALARCDDPPLAELASLRFWRGLALAGAGRASEAVETLRAAAAAIRPIPLAAQAALSCASILVRERQASDALLVLASIPPGSPRFLPKLALPAPCRNPPDPQSTSRSGPDREGDGPESP